MRSGGENVARKKEKWLQPNQTKDNTKWNRSKRQKKVTISGAEIHFWNDINCELYTIYSYGHGLIVVACGTFKPNKIWYTSLNCELIVDVIFVSTKTVFYKRLPLHRDILVLNMWNFICIDGIKPKNIHKSTMGDINSFHRTILEIKINRQS